MGAGGNFGSRIVGTTKRSRRRKRNFACVIIGWRGNSPRMGCSYNGKYQELITLKQWFDSITSYHEGRSFCLTSWLETEEQAPDYKPGHAASLPTWTETVEKPRIMVGN